MDMNSNDTYIGQIDLLSLVDSKLIVVENQAGIFIPIGSNPSIYRRVTKKGQEKAELDFVMRPTTNGLGGNTHFVKANVGTANRERMGLSKEEAQQYSPILGNAKPLARREEPQPQVQDDEDLPEGEFMGF